MIRIIVLIKILVVLEKTPENNRFILVVRQQSMSEMFDEEAETKNDTGCTILSGSFS